MTNTPWQHWCFFHQIQCPSTPETADRKNCAKKPGHIKSILWTCAQKNHIEAIHEQSTLKNPQEKITDAKHFAGDNLWKIKTDVSSNNFSYQDMEIPEITYCCICQKPKRKDSFHDKTYFSGAPLRQQPVIQYPRIGNYISSDNWKSQKTRTLVLVSEAKNCSSSMEK